MLVLCIEREEEGVHREGEIDVPAVVGGVPLLAGALCRLLVARSHAGPCRQEEEEGLVLVLKVIN